MQNTTNPFVKRILALALSGAMIVSSLTTSGLTVNAAENPRNTPNGYYGEASGFNEDNEIAQMEEAEEDEGNKDIENPVEAENEKDSQGTTKAEPSEAETSKTTLGNEEPVKTETVKETSDQGASEKEASTGTNIAASAEDEEQEKDEKAEDVKAYTYSAPSAGTKSTVWSNYEVFRGSVFGYSSQTVTDERYYSLGTDNGNMRIKVIDNGNKVASSDDGRAMYFYQVPIDSTFELRAKAKINSIGNIGVEQERNDAQTGFGLMARDDMLIDVKYDKEVHTNGAGYSSNYIAAGMLMGSAQATLEELQTSINCFSRVDGTLNRGASLGKIVTSGEYDLSLEFDGEKYICKIGDNEPVEYSVSLDNIDSEYQYIGMFVTRKADITYSDIYLKVDGKRILDQVSPRYSVTVSAEGNGTVKADSTSVIAGDPVTLTAQPEKGYYLDSWEILEGTGLAAEFEIDDNNQFTMPQGNVSVKAIFKELPTEWDFSTDTGIGGRIVKDEEGNATGETEGNGVLIEGTTGQVAGLKIDAASGKFDSTDSLDNWVELGAGTTITVPLAGESVLTVIGRDTNYEVDGTAAAQAEDTFECGGIFAKTAVITATADTAVKCIRVTSSGNEEVVIPETPRKIDVWDFGAKEQSGSDYENHIKTADWANFPNLAKGRFTVDPGDDPDKPIEDATASFGDLTFCYHINDILYSAAYTGGFNHQPDQSMRQEATYEYDDYTAAGEWYCNGTGGSNRRYITIDNVMAGDIIYAYVGISNGVETKFYFEYLGTDDKEQQDVGTVESGSTNGVNKKFTFTAQYSGTYKLWAEATTGKPFYNRIVRYPAAVVQGSIDWADISGKGLFVRFVNNTTNEVTEAVFDRAGYAAILQSGYTYTAKLIGKEGYGFAESCRKITISNTDAVNGKTHNLVVQNLELLPKQAVSGKFIGSGEKPLTGVDATKLAFQNIEDDQIYEAQLENDGYTIALRNGTYLAEITAQGYSTRTHVIINNADVERDLFLASTDNSPLDLVKNLYVNYPDKEENNFPTINAALKAAKRMNPQSEADRITIHVYPGTYREQVFVNTNYITLTNDTPEQDVVITWYYGIGYAYYSADETGYYNEESAYDKYDKHNASRWGCAVRVKATDFRAKNIIFENSFNRYITTEEIEDGVTLSIEGAGTEISFVRKATSTESELASNAATERAAALALDTGSDRSEFYKCTFLGSQDTLYTGDGKSRAYYKECVISGNTDYIFGDGNQVFENCELKWQGYTKDAKGGHITAAKDTSTLGYLFYHCKITANKASGYSVVAGTLGRPWGAQAKVTYVNTIQETYNLIADSGWGEMSQNKPINAVYKEYNTTSADGKAINFSKSPRKDILKTVDPTKTEGAGIKDYFGENWKPAFYEDGDTEGGKDEEGSTGSDGSEPNPDEPGSEPESNPGESETDPADDETEIRIVGLKSSYPYTGTKIIPDIEVWDGTAILSPDVDYKVTYKNNVNPGVNTAEITVAGKGNYAGKSEKKTFSITQVEEITTGLKNLSGAKIGKIGDEKYDGAAHYPEFTLTLKDKTSTTYAYDETLKRYTIKGNEEKPMDINVAVSNNVNKGTATIYVSGEKDAKKNKVTSAKATFKITPIDLSTADVKIEAPNATYAVSGAVPASLTVKIGEKTLTKGIDYTVKYTKNKKAGQTGTVTITGKGNYTKKKAAGYGIGQLDLSNLKVNAVTACDGMKPGKVKVTVVDQNGTALKASQYTIKIYKEEAETNTTEYDAATPLTAGSTIYAAVEAKDTTNLTGKTSRASFKVGIDISKAKIALAKVNGKVVTKSYTGKEVKLGKDDLTATIKVQGQSKELKMGEHYEIAAYTNNINKGTATAVIVGIGDYSGTKTIKFKITQKALTDIKWQELQKQILQQLSL